MTTGNGPIFVIGRQHSGNTMLTSIFGRHPDVHAFRGEDRFFEHVERFRAPPSEGGLERLANIVADAHMPMLPSDERADIKKYLQRAAAGSSSPTSPAALYLGAKECLASKTGATRWAQKATSYAFHLETLVKHIPKAKLVFLLRNPLDIAASLRIRKSEGHWLRMCMGWSRGVETARRAEDAHPKRILVIRYEDLVQEPKDRISSIFEFCNLEFDDSVLSIERVNSAHNPYETESDRSGISDEKVCYYQRHLSPPEVAAIVEMVGPELLRNEYPNLASSATTNMSRRALTRTKLTLKGMRHIVTDLWRRVSGDPIGTAHRFWHRIGT